MFSNTRDENASGPRTSVVKPVSATDNFRDPLNHSKSASDQRNFNAISGKDVIIPKQTNFQAGILKSYINEWRAFTKDPIALQAVAGAKLPLKRAPLLKSPDQVLLTYYNIKCFKT